MDGFPWGNLIFWGAVVAVVGFVAWSRLQRERERQQTLRVIAERGQALDKEAMEKLFPKGLDCQSQKFEQSPRQLVRGLTVGGIVTLFIGVGLLAGAQILGRIDHDGLIGMSIGGTITTMVGLGLLVAALVTHRMALVDDRAALQTDPRQ